MVEERKIPQPSSAENELPGARQQLATAFNAWNTQLGVCSTDLVCAEATKKLHANNDLEQELLSQAMMVGDIVVDMRTKVLANLVS